jgi:hypothetical protein
MSTIIICALATYGICILVVEKDGLLEIFQKLRSRVKVLRCVACLSVWVSAPLAYFMGIGVTEYLAVVGLVLFMDRLDI